MSKLQNNCCSKLGSQKVNYNVEGTWLIHGTEHRKDNQ